MDARPDEQAGDGGKQVRLFLALWPDEAVRGQLLAWRDAWSWPRGASPVHPAKLHLTLHFLGDQPAARLPGLADGFAVPFEPFSLALGHPELWPHGIAVLEPHETPPELLALHGRLDGALRGLGLRPEARAYRPHVTLARRAAGAGAPAGGPRIDWQVSGYALVESKLGRDGGYRVLRHYP